MILGFIACVVLLFLGLPVGVSVFFSGLLYFFQLISARHNDTTIPKINTNI